MVAHPIYRCPPCIIPGRSVYHSGYTRLLWFVLAIVFINKIVISSFDLPVYNFLDPNIQHGRLAAWIIGIAVAGAVIFSVTRMICVLRERFFANRRAKRRGDGESIHSEQLEEWETVERNDASQVTRPEQGPSAV